MVLSEVMELLERAIASECHNTEVPECVVELVEPKGKMLLTTANDGCVQTWGVRVCEVAKPSQPVGRVGEAGMRTEKEVRGRLAELMRITHCGYTREDLDMEDPAVARVLHQEALDAEIGILEWMLDD